MNKLYVKDRQTGKLNYFKSLNEVVLFLENSVISKTKMNRQQWMQHIVDLGGGYDDVNGKVFTESLENYFETGIMQKDGRHVRCNIHEAASFTKSEYGD